MAGFPWHPHRGIETITYLIQGGIQHEDSLGNSGILQDGDVQWMTAGSGIIHQEMPAPGASALYHGFQLWSNLPSSKKMMDPRYQDIPAAEIPEVIEDDGSKARIITGDFWGKTGPVTGIFTNPRYLDISLPVNRERSFKIQLEQNAFAYVFQGEGRFFGASAPGPVMTEYITPQGATDPIPSHPAENRSLVLIDQGDEIRVRAGEQESRECASCWYPVSL
ncbi:MAG: pirin family protein [Spirochaetaceae bacterium]|jgi:redox-sensitive bicupin YhaK (pirin superfamily)|nr:pirin family protein [Spirochaetaceae bacterium]